MAEITAFMNEHLTLLNDPFKPYQSRYTIKVDIYSKG